MSDFKITGPGWYRARGGDKVEIIGRRSTPHTLSPWIGFLNSGEGVGASAWTDGGKNSRGCSEVDLIAPWTEPKKGTVWVNVYDHGPVSYRSRELADKDMMPDRLACIQVNWTEGEGLS